MRLLSVFLLLLSCLTCNGQNFGAIYTYNYWTAKQVQHNMDKQLEKGKKNGSVPSSLKSSNGDTLTYVVNHKVDAFTLKLTFQLNEFEEAYCDFQEFSFDCTPCSQKHLKGFMDYYRFRQKEGNVYLSKPSYKTEMTVIYKSDSKDCLTIIFRAVSLPKKEYKTIYKGLNKKPTG